MGILFTILLVIGFIIFIYKALNSDDSISSYTSSDEILNKYRNERKNKLASFMNDSANETLYVDERNVLVIDLETTGLPINRDAPASDLDNWPKIVSIALLLYNKNGSLIEDYYTELKQLSPIPESAIAIHKITTEQANENGIEFKELAEKLLYFSERSSILSAHNIDFDYKVLQAELKRNKFKNYYVRHKKVCTMVKGRRVTGRNNKLLNLVEECYGATLGNQNLTHNANIDARLTAAVFFYLLSMDYIKDDIFN